MKEVNIIPDDAKSAECLKQLEQVLSLSHFSHLCSEFQYAFMVIKSFLPAESMACWQSSYKLK